jgi:hypothetical protein
VGAEEDNAVAAAIASLVTDNPFLKLIPTSIIGQMIAAHTAQTTLPRRTVAKKQPDIDEEIPPVIVIEDPPLNKDLPDLPEQKPIDGPTWMEKEQQKREEEKREAEAREMWRKSEEQRKKTDRLFPPPAIRQPAIILDETREQAERRKQRARQISQQQIISRPGGRSTGGGKGILTAEEGTTKGKDDETSKDKDKDPTSDDKVPIDQRPFARKGQPPEEPPEEPDRIEVTPGDPTLWRDWRATQGDPDAPWNYVSKAMQRLDPSEMGPDGRPVRFARGPALNDTDLYQVIENMEDKDNPILLGSYDLMQGYVGTFLAGKEGQIEIWTDRDTTMEDLNQADSVEYTATTGKPLEYLETGTVQGRELGAEKHMMDQLDSLRASLAKLDGGLVSNEAKAYIWDIARRRAFDFRNVMDIMRDPAARFSGKFESLQVDPETAKRITDHHPDVLRGVIPPADPTDMHYMTAQHSPNLLVGQVNAFFREINDLVFRIEKQARISPLRGMSARDLEARLSQNEIADATRESVWEQVPNAQWFRTEIPYTVEFKVDRTRPEFNNPDGSPWSPRPGLGRITEYELQEGSPYGKVAYVTWKDLTREERRDILTAAENGWDLPAHRITWHEVGDYGERQASAISDMDYRQIAQRQAEFNIADYAMHQSQIPPSEFDHVVEFDSKGRPGGLVPQQFRAEYKQWSDQIRENNKSTLQEKNVSEGYSQFVEDKILSNQADEMSEVQLSRIREEMRDRIPDGDNAAMEYIIAYGSRTPERDEIQAITQYDRDSPESHFRPHFGEALSFERYSDFADGARSSTMGSMLEGGKDPEVGKGFRSIQGRHEPPIGESYNVAELNDFIRQVRLDPANFKAWVKAQDGESTGYADYAAKSKQEQEIYDAERAAYLGSSKDWQAVTNRERPVALRDLSDKELARRLFDLIEEYQTVSGEDWITGPMWRKINDWRVNPRYKESQAKLDWELGLPSAHGVMDQMSDHRVPHLQREITEHLATLAMRVHDMEQGEFPEIYFDPSTWKDVYDAQPSQSPIDRSYGYEPYKPSSILYEEALAFEKLMQPYREQETIDENLALTTSGDVTLDELRNDLADVDTVAMWMGEHVADEGNPMPPQAEKFLREMIKAHAEERDMRQKGLPNKPFDPAVRENLDALRMQREVFNELVLDRLWSRHGAKWGYSDDPRDRNERDIVRRWNNLDDKAKQAVSIDYSDEKFKEWYEGQVAVLRRMSNAELSQALRPFNEDQINSAKYHGPEAQWIDEARLDMAYNEAHRRLDKILKDVDHWAQDPDWGK